MFLHLLKSYITLLKESTRAILGRFFRFIRILRVMRYFVGENSTIAQRIKDKKLFTAHEIAGALVRSAEFQTAQMKNEESLSSAVEFEAISKSNRARVKVGTGSFF